MTTRLGQYSEPVLRQQPRVCNKFSAAKERWEQSPDKYSLRTARKPQSLGSCLPTRKNEMVFWQSW